MAHGGDAEKGEASRKRLSGLPESGVKPERAKKKLRATENVSKLTRKRAWNEVTETENLTDFQDSRRDSTSHSPSRKVLRVGSVKETGGSQKSRGLEPNTQESVQGPAGHPLRKWKRSLAKLAANFGDRGIEINGNSGSSGSCLRRASEETRSAVEEESAGIVSSLEHTGLNGKVDRKRREADVDKGEGSSPPWQPPEKKLRMDVIAGVHGEQGARVSLAPTCTWKRLRRQKTGNSSAAASEDMGVSISEAWKRLRDEKDTETSGSSVNGRSGSDLSMHSCPSIPEWIEERSKKARYDSPLPSAGRKWKRRNREQKLTSSSKSKRLRDGNGCSESSGSSGSDMAQSPYLHNRKWKRPRYENLMSMQGRTLRRQSLRDGEEARDQSSRKRVLSGDVSERSSDSKWPRK